MATNVREKQTSVRSDEPETVIETANMPIRTSTGVGGVEVYDNDEVSSDMPHRPTGSLVEDRMPVEAPGRPSTAAWIIGALVLILLVYFLLQFVF